MRILAIETATITGSVAILEDGIIRGEITTSVSVQHSERLMTTIARIVEDAGLKIQDIDLFAASVGPGSFTGLRIGIAAAQGLALAQNKPIIGIPTLEALALNAFCSTGLIVPVLNAFRSEVFRGIYRINGGNLETAQGDRAISIPDFCDELKNLSGPILVLGPGLEVCGKALQDLGREQISLMPSTLGVPKASQVAWLASQRGLNLGKNETLLPRYLRQAG